VEDSRVISQQPLVFGVFPFGIAGGPEGLVSGPPDDVGRIGEALQELAGDGPPLLVRMYVTFEGSVTAALDQVAQFAQIGGLVDLSLSFHDRDGDVEQWCQASAALGFTAAGDMDTAGAKDSFWRGVAQRGGVAFASALDFAGLTMYPGGFDADAPSINELVGRTVAMLTTYRGQLSDAGIPDTVPIRISECGWPTGPGRSEADQAEALSAIVHTVAGLRRELFVTHWELFTLRDADSSSDDPFGHFGILRDDYSRKPAYGALRSLIRGADGR
jgi:hypothetical protein